jgi:ATP-binding cassette subfamily B multidrug efflux pump
VTLLQLVSRFARRHWRAYASASAMLLGVAVLTVWVPRRVGDIIDALVGGRLSGMALALELAILVAMGVAIYLLRVGWRFALFSAAFRLGVELRTRLYDRLALQGPTFFHRQRTGDLMARATNDVDAVEMAAGEAYLAAFDGTLTLVLVVAMMTLGVDWRLAVVALLPFPFMAWAFFHISRHVHDAWRHSLDRFSDLNEQVQESMSAVRTLRALGLEAQAGREFARHAQRAADTGFEAQKWEAAYEPAVGLTLTTASALTLAVGGWFVWHQEMTIGALTAFTMYLGQLIWPMFAAGWVLSLIERGKAAWARLDPLLREPLSIADQGTRAMAPEGGIRFDAVGFTYPSPSPQVHDAPAARGSREIPIPADAPSAFSLRAIDFELPSGRTLGIVGPTGAGKSTLLNLLLRHYEPCAGVIGWGGTAIADYRLDVLRSGIAWVPQEAFLFSATIAENIALARTDATRADIENAARLADLHADILRFAQGYETRVGERGVTLSGGQRQRVAIARALLSAAPLLLLDDALSAVDTGTEARILAKLRDVRGGRTAMIVSHRLSAVADADEIIVLQHGRIVERGTHDALVARDGWYAAQWRYQQLEASLETA